MRCPACGAHNTDAAEWCTQCLGRLEDPAADRRPELDDEPEPVPAAPPVTPAAAVTRGDVRTHGGDVEWRCGACDTWNAFPEASCRTCGAPMVRDTSTTVAGTERARRMLWAVAVAICLVTVVAVVLLITALQGA